MPTITWIHSAQSLVCLQIFLGTAKGSNGWADTIPNLRNDPRSVDRLLGFLFSDAGSGENGRIPHGIYNVRLGASDSICLVKPPTVALFGANLQTISQIVSARGMTAPNLLSPNGQPTVIIVPETIFAAILAFIKTPAGAELQLSARER